MSSESKAVALELHLKSCSNVTCLGVRPNFSDYSPDQAAMIRDAPKIYYPSTFYADMFAAMGKPIFPSIHTYRFVQDKVRQSALFEILDIPRPKTRTFYGPHRKEKILRHFSYPFVAKIARGSALGRGVHLIESGSDLDEYCDLTKTAYIQQYLPVDRDIRVVVIGGRVAHSYWRIAAPGEFRSNLGCGGSVNLDPVPAAACELALNTALRCGWDDVGIDICMWQDRLYVLEANMKYGRAGFVSAGIDYFKMMEDKIRNGEI